MRRYPYGFSLIEALVVLAIAGMVLAIVFSIGIRAGDAGFALGRRALESSDSDISRSDFRVIVQSMALRPNNMFAAGDPATVGADRRLESEVVMARSTQCALKGWAGILRLEIRDQVGGGSAVVCLAGDREIVLFRVPRAQAQFSYSVDGVNWTPTFDNTPPDRQDFANIRSANLWVRLRGGSDLDLVARATTGRPDVWIRPYAD